MPCETCGYERSFSNAEKEDLLTYLYIKDFSSEKN